MVEVLLPSVVGVGGVVIGVVLSSVLNREKTGLEVQRLRIEIQSLQLQRDKMRVDLEKATVELDLLRDQHLKMLADEFWRKVTARATETGREQATWLATKQAFLHFADADLVASESLLMQAERAIAELSRKYVGKTLSNQELLLASNELETWEDRLGVEEHAVYLKERSFNDLPYEERDRRPLEVELESLRSVQHSLHALRGDVVRQSLLPGMLLPGVDLSYLNLSGMDLSGVSLQGSSLHGAKLCSTTLRRANLDGCRLNVSKLIGADLEEASLLGASLYNAELQQANLSGADMTDANLAGANLTKATMAKTILRRARYSKGKTVPHDTKWPDGFDPVAAGAVLDG